MSEVCRCPQIGCDRLVSHKLWTELLDEQSEQLVKVHQYWRDAYVLANPSIKYCPAAGCQFAVELQDVKVAVSR